MVKRCEDYLNTYLNNTMKHQNYYFALLLCASALVGCSTDVEEEFPAEAQPGQEWKAVALATRDSIEVGDADESSTRALFYGGNSRRFYTLWDQGDEVTVYKNNVSVGTMTPTTYGTLTATLQGTLTGNFAVNDVLDVYLPSAAMDFTGQKGTIYDLSSHFSFQHATATVQEAANQILSLSDVNPSHRQEYLRFVLMNEDGSERLHPTRFELHAISGGHIVESMAEDGTITPCDMLAITPELEDGEYPEQLFVALLNDDDTEVTYRLKAEVGSDIYVGPISTQSAFKSNSRSYLGQLSRIRRNMLLTSPASGLTIEDIPDYTFTGYPITPDAGDVTVKDGEDVLTLNTDYSYAGSNNVNVGEATLTVTGLAMSGPRAETKYLGTKTKTFNIVKATPVIEVSTDKMSLVNHEGGTTSQTRAVTRVFIDNNANGTWDEGVDFDITDAVTINYESANTGVCTVTNAGLVTAVGPGTDVTITITVAAAANWTEKTATFLVDVQGEVRNGNQIDPWGNGGKTTDDTHTGY